MIRIYIMRSQTIINSIFIYEFLNDFVKGLKGARWAAGGLAPRGPKRGLGKFFILSQF